MHKNHNHSLGNYGIYEIIVKNKIYKIGKADLDRITVNSGNPTRIHQQIRKLQRQYGVQNVFFDIIQELLGVSTKTAKEFEQKVLEIIYAREGYIPEGNKKSFNPKNPTL